MRHPAVLDADLAKLVHEASLRPMTASERQHQLVSFAYGNVKLENDRVTKSLVAQAFSQLSTSLP